MFYPYPFNQSSSNKVLHGDGTWQTLKIPEIDVKTTYSVLKDLRDNNQLSSGTKYCITDYLTTTSQQDTQSAGHQFDIVVEALTPNVLSENAKAVQHGSGATGLYLWEKYDQGYGSYASEAGEGAEQSKFYIVTDRLYEPGSLSLTNYATVLGTLRAPNADEIAYTTERFGDVLVECVLKDIDCPNAVDMGGGKQLTVYKNDLEGYESGSKDYQTPDYGDWYVYVGQFDDVNHLFGEVADDPYFNDANLNAWEIKYCLDNDTSRFAWADETNGKGVIYYMKDEWNNECPYDFKNIQFKRKLTNGSLDTTSGTDTWVYTFNFWDGSECKDYTLYNGQSLTDSDSITAVRFMVYDNLMLPYYQQNGSSSSNCIFRLNDNVFLNVGNQYSACYNNVFRNNCYSNSFGNKCYSNSFGDGCHSNSFGNGCYSNSFRNNCYSNSFGYDCYNNSFGNKCYSNSFVGGCNANSFGNQCYSNSFRYKCYNNSFGNSCYSNSFGNYCRNNSFGNECYSNSFGNVCQSNSFGNSCYDNSFGNSCQSNSFENDCYDNSFGNGCQSNSFENDCYGNSFGNQCQSNSFGNYCGDIRFDKQYTGYCIIEDGNRDITLTTSQTTSSSAWLRNIQISLGVHNTGGTLTITHPTVNDTFMTTYKPINSVEVSV